MQKMNVYADNAATTRVSRAALDAAMPYFTEDFGNAASSHSAGMSAAKAVLDARAKTAGALGAKVGEVYFTSGATESDNWAIMSAAALGEKSGKRHIVTTAIEHHAVLNTCKALEKKGFEVTYLPVGSSGIVDTEDIKNALRDDTCLVSIMLANNEVGTLQPVSQAGALCRERGILFHTDAVQAVGQMKINVDELCADMLSLSGHKFHAMKGVGVLYVRSGTELVSFIHGGEQEKGRRAGTHNVPAIVSLGTAIAQMSKDTDKRSSYIKSLSDRLAHGILHKVPGTHLNGDREKRLAGNVNICFDGVEGESLLMMLDMKGICVSSGSACASGSLEPSHVLTAMGLDRAKARGSIRFSLNEENTGEEIEYILSVLPEIIDKLRHI